MSLVYTLERKFGWLAIRGILRILVGFQLLTFLLIQFQPGSNFGAYLVLDPGQILQGQVWRLVSFVVLPPTDSALVMVFVVFFTIFIGDMLERMWGSFRLTLYVLGGIVGMVLAAFFAYYVVGVGGYLLFFSRTAFIWITMVLLAVAVLEPDMQINLWGVIPVKMKWLGIFNGGIILIDLVQLTRVHVLLGVALLIAIANFLIVFGPSMVKGVKHRGEVAARRREFDAARKPADESLHRCHACGKTESDDAELDFRVASDGEEYCVEHLPSKT